MGVLAVSVGKATEALPFEDGAGSQSKYCTVLAQLYDALILERLADAKAVFDQAKSKGAKGDGFDKLEKRLDEARKDMGLMLL